MTSLMLLPMNAESFIDRQWFSSLSPHYMKNNLSDLRLKKVFFSNSADNDLSLGGLPFYNIAFGKNISPLISTEISVRIANVNNDLSQKMSKIKMHSLFFNGYLKKQISSKLIPYVMAGIGGQSSARNNMIDNRSSGKALYDIGIGTYIKITEHLLVDLNYKQLDLGGNKLKTSDNLAEKIKIRNKEFMLNLVYNF